MSSEDRWPGVTIHPLAVVEDGAQIGAGTSIWHHAHVRSGAVLGENCTIGKSVYIDSGARLGSLVKVQNFVSVFSGVTIEDRVLVGPSVTFTNDLFPRVREGTDLVWEETPTLIKSGVGLGANSTIVCGATVGEYALVGAGSVIVGDVPDHALMVGVPSKQIGWVNDAGDVISRDPERPAELS